MQKKKTLRQITFIFTFIVLSSCGQVSTDKKIEIDPKARTLNDSAVSLHMTFDKKNTMKAIELLDNATEIDPDYFLAHWNKYVFQNELNQKDKAFETLKTLERLRPESPDLMVASGIFHENNGDSLTANKKFQQANRIYVNILDTLDTNNNQYSSVASNKAINLILLGQEQEGRQILQDLYDKEKNEPMKEMIGHFLTLSRQQLLDEMKNKK